MTKYYGGVDQSAGLNHLDVLLQDFVGGLNAPFSVFSTNELFMNIDVVIIDKGFVSPQLSLFYVVLVLLTQSTLRAHGQLCGYRWDQRGSALGCTSGLCWPPSCLEGAGILTMTNLSLSSKNTSFFVNQIVPYHKDSTLIFFTFSVPM